jgi:preprotein translocase subunit SecE
VQASQLPDDEVEAEHSGPLRGQEILPLVRQAYRAPRDEVEVARNTRQQRRRRNRQQQQQNEASPKEQGVSQRARSRQAQVRPAAQPPKTQTGRRGPGGGSRRFISESAAELKKVEWPGQRQVMTGTVVVLIACAIVGTYLYLADLVFQPFVEHVLLGR